MKISCQADSCANTPNSIPYNYVSTGDAIVIVNDDQQDATIQVYLIIPGQLYMFRALSLLIIRST